MSKLDAIMIDLWGGKIPMDDGPDDLKLAIKAKQEIKDLIRELMADAVEELLAKDSTSASDYINILQKKVEDL